MSEKRAFKTELAQAGRLRCWLGGLAGSREKAAGLGGRVPLRMDAATKAGLLDLLEDAVDAGWPVRRARHELELGQVRAHRWLATGPAGSRRSGPVQRGPAPRRRRLPLPERRT